MNDTMQTAIIVSSISALIIGLFAIVGFLVRGWVKTWITNANKTMSDLVDTVEKLTKLVSRMQADRALSDYKLEELRNQACIRIDCPYKHGEDIPRRRASDETNPGLDITDSAAKRIERLMQLGIEAGKERNGRA